MAATDDLAAAVTALTGVISEVVTALGATTGATDDAAIEQAVTTINAAVAQLKAALPPPAPAVVTVTP